MKLLRLALTIATLVGLSIEAPLQAQLGPSAVTNFSLLVQVSPGVYSPPLGIVIPAGSHGYLIRAVGPSLVNFAVPNPMPTPIIHIFNAAGADVSLSTLSAPGRPLIFSEVGAFPLNNGTGDAYMIFGAAPGAYSIQVKDVNGKGGTVLIELYTLAANTAL